MKSKLFVVIVAIFIISIGVDVAVAAAVVIVCKCYVSMMHTACNKFICGANTRPIIISHKMRARLANV